MELRDYQLERIEVIRTILNNLGDNFVLKGGTSLFLYYGLDRYSEDIDLDIISGNMNIESKLRSINPEWKFNIKKDTETVFRIMVDYGSIKDEPYPLKIEISSRNKNLLRENKISYNKIDGVNVYTLEEIAKMKIQAFSGRDKIRDFYDLGYLLEYHEELFSWEDIYNIHSKFSYSDFDDLAYLLNEEINKGVIQDIDPDVYILNVNEKIEELLEKLERSDKRIR